MGVLGPRLMAVVGGWEGWGQGKLRRKEVGRESGLLESWEVDCRLWREEMLAVVSWVRFEGSGWDSGRGGAARGQTAGVGSSKIVLRRLGCVEGGFRELGFRVGVSSSISALLSSSR